MDSILTSIKVLLGITEEDESFDLNIIMDVNTALASLSQLGVGPKDGFSIKDKTTTWHEFVGDDKRLNMVISYVHLRTWLLFDLNLSAAVIAAIERQILELEWRINNVSDFDK